MNALPDIKIAQLRHFVAVVDHQGFKAAARALFRSQPAISVSIKELENLIGAPLFEKNMQSALTPFGKQFYLAARKLLEHYNGTIRGAVDLAHLNAGQVRVAVVPSVAREVLSRTITPFIATHPGIELWVEDGDADYVRARVASGDVDFGCSSSTSLDARLDFTEVISDSMGVVCSIKHPLAAQTHVRWTQLNGNLLISNGSMRLLERHLADTLIQGSKLHISNITSLLALIEANIGITILPYLAYPKSSKNICFVPLKSPVAKRTIGIVQLSAVSLSPAAEAFRSALIQELEQLKMAG